MVSLCSSPSSRRLLRNDYRRIYVLSLIRSKIWIYPPKAMHLIMVVVVVVVLKPFKKMPY